MVQPFAPYPFLHQLFLCKVLGHLNLTLVNIEAVEVVGRNDRVPHASDHFRFVARGSPRAREENAYRKRQGYRNYDNFFSHIIP